MRGSSASQFPKNWIQANHRNFRFIRKSVSKSQKKGKSYQAEILSRIYFSKTGLKQEEIRKGERNISHFPIGNGSQNGHSYLGSIHSELGKYMWLCHLAITNHQGQWVASGSILKTLSIRQEPQDFHLPNVPSTFLSLYSLKEFLAT